MNKNNDNGEYCETCGDYLRDCICEEEECEHEDWTEEEAEEYVYGASVERGPYRSVQVAVCTACGAQTSHFEEDEEADEDGYVLRTAYPVWN